jgi:hypothetical protein
MREMAANGGYKVGGKGGGMQNSMRIKLKELTREIDEQDLEITQIQR